MSGSGVRAAQRPGEGLAVPSAFLIISPSLPFFHTEEALVSQRLPSPRAGRALWYLPLDIAALPSTPRKVKARRGNKSKTEVSPARRLGLPDPLSLTDRFQGLRGMGDMRLVKPLL